MALEIEGKIIRKLARQGGTNARGDWSKQEFVLEYQDGNYPAQVCFTSFGDEKIADLEKYQIGDEVKISFNIRAREYNGRWYNDIRVWRITPASQADSEPHQGRNLSPAPSLEDMPQEKDGEDDMPF